ncbi:hypothetical protein [Scandinavium goeteborgense]|uniref:hypothetical protein n=1 Tax=Scandinavium goeteborgense TaxID=1851514 RepID=UPI000F66147A|nr:hypothetical protein [Scandinavium goeteborgense]QKN82203.1 hypothetical protein A8O29_013240 [Scandinavium goeteborgense]
MSKSNIDRFDEIAGRVFADLYDSFPLPIHLKTEDYLQKDTIPSEDPIDGTMRYSIEEEIIEATIKWLNNAEFLCYGAERDHVFVNVTLTPKGLESLKLMPDSVKGPTGSQLSDAVKTGGIETIKMLANHAIGIGARITAQKFGFHV